LLASSVFAGEGSFTISTTGIRENQIPESFLLLSNYPNLFNNATWIVFELKKSGNVCIEIFNMRGQRIHTLVNSRRSAISHSVVWTGVDFRDKPVGSGVYFLNLTLNGRTYATRKCLLLK